MKKTKLDWWTRDAGSLQKMGIDGEEDMEWCMHYDEAQTRRAVVHTRHDVILLVSYLMSANKQLSTISKILWTILAVLIYIALALSTGANP